MAEYQSLLWPDAAPIKSSGKGLNLRGCEYCPRNEIKGIRKVKGRVLGKKLFVWAQNPGKQENIEGVELIGPSGTWFWDSLRREAQLERSDCDIQNVMRCWDADWHNGKLVKRKTGPSKEELFCCSIYTDQAILKSKARVHLVLGQVAAHQLFGKSYHGDRIFWSEKLNGRVVVVDHPSTFISGYSSAAKLKNYRAGLQAVARFLKMKPGKFGYLEEKDYEGITTAARARVVADDIRESAKKGIRISVDLEDDIVDGRRVALCYGFSSRRGSARVFLLDYPGLDTSVAERAAIRQEVISLLADGSIKKICHHGSYDCDQTKEELGCKLAGYDYDTNYAEYFAYPGRWSYALAEITAVRYHDYAGFKEVVMPEAAPKGMSYDQAYKTGKLRFANVPWDKLVLRNAADADLTKQIEMDTREEISQPLLHVYMDAAFTLDRMEKNGPWFDYRQCELLGEIYPVRLKRQKEQLQVMARDPNFNPGSPPQVAKVLYGTLKLSPVSDKFGNEKFDTGHDTLTLLSVQHDFPKKVIQYREDSKLESTYRSAFKDCADAHGGRLFTKWWLTGAKTGRLSSGGSRDGEEFLTVNLQNIVGDEQVENMLVSDKNWRDIYRAWKDRTRDDWYEEFLDREVYLKLDYAQNELRFLAQSSGDEALIEAFQSGRDIHCEVGHELTGWSVEVIAKDREKRTLIKGFHFGMVYGLTVDGMLGHLKRSGVKVPCRKNETEREAVERMMASYFKRYQKVKGFIAACRRQVEEEGYVENILGFRCSIDVTGESKGGYWENLAVNAPIQGGAHQLLLMALAVLHRMGRTYRLMRTPESENHDALLFRVKLRDLFEGLKLAVNLLEKEVLTVLRDDFGLEWKVPLLAEAKAGFRYGVTVDVTEGMTIGQFMNNWCVANQVCERALWTEIRRIRNDER